MRYLSKYTEQEIDAVIDAHDLGFMRNKLKQSDSDLRRITNTLAGAGAVLSVRTRILVDVIVGGLPRWMKR